jgi:hypothetical protein
MHIARSKAYSQLWRIVDGAVRDALETHPDYLTKKGMRSARASITKRVTGAVLGYTSQVAEGRSGGRPAAATGAASGHKASSRGVDHLGLSKWRGWASRFCHMLGVRS